jgi:hypothetical protein
VSEKIDSRFMIAIISVSEGQHGKKIPFQAQSGQILLLKPDTRTLPAKAISA